MLPTLNCDFYRDHYACYDPAEKLGEDWEGTALDILNHPDVPSEDKIWAISQKGAMPESLQRLCAVAFVKNTPLSDGRKVFDLLEDERSKRALLIAVKHARGEATDKELSAACDAAWSACDAAWSACAAARFAARSAAAAANNAGRFAARSAAARTAQVEIAIHVINQELNLTEQ